MGGHDAGSRVHTFCTGLSPSLLLNFHFTPLRELEENYPLFHAPLTSPTKIIPWAQKLIINSDWTAHKGF